MPTIEDTINKLRDLFDEVERAKASASRIFSNPRYSPGMKDDLTARVEHVINGLEREMQEALKFFRAFPPDHAHDAVKLREFHQNGGYEDSVFIMTKYPDPDGDPELNSALDRVIREVSRSIEIRHPYRPRIASVEYGGKQFYEYLWPNVEIHLLGCSKGLAILEDKYRPELNPNVAIEWGWMRGMGREVRCLLEEDFDHERADWSGLLKTRFSWNNPEKGIEAAIQEWLGDPNDKTD